MQNEFEKQVQQKLEELKLVPSEPVWQKVEMQIRQKKDRRRLVFWLPLSALILGGGIWIAVSQYSKLNYNKGADSTPQSTLPVATEKSNTNAEKPNNTATINNPEASIQNKTVQTKPDNKVHPATTKPDLNFKEPVSQKIFSGESKRKQKKSTETTKEISAKKDETTSINTETTDQVSTQPNDKINKNESHSEIIKDSTANTIDKKEEKNEIVTAIKPDSVNHDTALLKKPAVKKIAMPKWKYSVAVGTGISGLGRLNIYNGAKDSASNLSYSGSPNQNPGGSVRNGPSAIKKGLSIAIGILARRQLNKQINFSAGLQYNYYSNTITVGNKVAQTTVIRDFSVSQYYSNNSTASQTYRNHYHFISLPLAIDWKLLKRLPLDFHAGLSLQYLIHTNALVFDYNRQAYFYSKKTFNSMQLLSGLGFSYSFPIKDRSLAIGPELQYGLSRLEKKNPDHHLFSYGIKAQIQFDKK
jgi:Outer membrane protein beta-barrel domain